MLLRMEILGWAVKIAKWIMFAILAFLTFYTLILLVASIKEGKTADAVREARAIVIVALGIVAWIWFKRRRRKT